MAGTWTKVVDTPAINASTMLLLTDGTVLVHDEGPSFAGSNHWWRITPDQNGSYVNGTWTQFADGPNSPLFFASAVLADGRVFVAGGEYNGSSATADLLAAEILDPVANTWTALPTPPTWTAIGDASSCVLPDGTLLLGSIKNNQTAIYDPVSNTWRAAGAKLNATSNEETWTLLPDGTVLTLDCFGHPKSEKYVIASDKWIWAGSTPNELVEDASKEIGPALLMYDGRVFAVGATKFTALYTAPGVPTAPGVWADGPQFPPAPSGQDLGAKDAPGCLLPNGKVLCVAGPVDGTAGSYLSPTFFFEFDPTTDTLARVPDAPNNTGAPFSGRMLLLPTGEVLFSNGSNDIEAYAPDGVPQDAWRPLITDCPSDVQVGRSFTLSGTQLNGLSQAVSYGDDAQMATNYPIVRIVNNATGHVAYCQTSGHSTMGVATGAAVHSTNVQVPSTIETGPSQLFVVANGIPSAPVAVNVNP